MVLAMSAGFLGAAHATRHAGAFRATLACCALYAPLPPLLTAAVQLRVFFPEAWSPSGMALLGFPDPESMVGATLICAGSACILAARGLLLRNWIAAGWLIPAFLSAAILVPLYLFLGVGSAEVTPSGAAFTPARLPATLLVLYLAARIGAKLAVAARVRRDPELVLASLICLLGAPVSILWTPGPVPIAVAAGMLAGPAISRGRNTACPPSRLWWVLPGLPVALALLRLAVPLPGDSRDYVARADILVRRHRADEAETLLRRVLAWCPEESRAAWQMAWLRLYQDEPDGAAYWAARSLRQSASGLPPRFFPHPGPEEVQAFLNAVRDRCGLAVEVITGEREAALIHQGVTSDPYFAGQPLLVVDVGGGSAEFIQAHRRASLPLGAVRLTEMFRDDFGALCAHVRTALAPVLTTYRQEGQVLVATGGTISSGGNGSRRIGSADRRVMRTYIYPDLGHRS